MDKFIGKRLDGRYEFEELIGMGGMANVYKAFDSVDQKKVAIKILKEEYQSNEEFLRCFRNESKAIATLSHPNIVRIFDVNFGDKIQYIVMELIDGITLKEFIEKTGPLKWKDTVHFSVQILRALQHAHDKGIVHRDIKPQNIMLLEDGTIKVMDFGIARFARDEKRSTEQTVGSVHYISPEQASGEVTDEKSDLYSTGIMMFEMLTGTLPFDGETPEAVAVKQMQAPPPALRSIKEDIPEGLEEIVVRSMQKNPSKRYQSAAEMLRDIDEFKQNPSIKFEYKYFDDGTTKYFNAQGEEEEEEDKKKSKFIPILVGVSAAFVIVTAIVIGIMIFANNNKVEDVEIENFVGQYYDDLVASDDFLPEGKYGKLDLNTKEEYNDDYEEGYICAQDPEAPVKIKANSKLTLTVSKGPKTISMPDVINMDKDAAKKALVEKGFNSANIKLVSQESDTISKNYVISSDPTAGTELGANDSITLYYSSGQASTVQIPNVIDQTSSAAKTTLENLGLSVNIVEADSSKAAGTVIAQNPTGGSTAKLGSKVILTISNGSQVVTPSQGPTESKSPTSTTTTALVPGVIGLSYEDAVKRLNGDGFKLVEKNEVANLKPAGTVIAQSPGEDSAVDTSTKIVLTVSTGKAAGGDND